MSSANISTRYACILLRFDGDTLILVFLEVCLFPILTYSLSTIMAALHSSSVSLNMSVMSIFVLTVAQLSSGMRFPKGLKRISFVVGSIVVDVKNSSPKIVKLKLSSFDNFVLMFLLELLLAN